MGSGDTLSSRGDNPADDVTVLSIECGMNTATLHLPKTADSGKAIRVNYDGAWLRPNVFQAISGRGAAKDWKRSIKHHGRSLKLLISKAILSLQPPVCRCELCALQSGVVGDCEKTPTQDELPSTDDVQKKSLVELPNDTTQGDSDEKRKNGSQPSTVSKDNNDTRSVTKKGDSGEKRENGSQHPTVPKANDTRSETKKSDSAEKRENVSQPSTVPKANDTRSETKKSDSAEKRENVSQPSTVPKVNDTRYETKKSDSGEKRENVSQPSNAPKANDTLSETKKSDSGKTRENVSQPSTVSKANNTHSETKKTRPGSKKRRKKRDRGNNANGKGMRDNHVTGTGSDVKTVLKPGDANDTQSSDDIPLSVLLANETVQGRGDNIVGKDVTKTDSVSSKTKKDDCAINGESLPESSDKCETKIRRDVFETELHRDENVNENMRSAQNTTPPKDESYTQENQVQQQDDEVTTSGNGGSTTDINGCVRSVKKSETNLSASALRGCSAEPTPPTAAAAETVHQAINTPWSHKHNTADAISSDVIAGPANGGIAVADSMPGCDAFKSVQLDMNDSENEAISPSDSISARTQLMAEYDDDEDEDMPSPKKEARLLNIISELKNYKRQLVAKIETKNHVPICHPEVPTYDRPQPDIANTVMNTLRYAAQVTYEQNGGSDGIPKQHQYRQTSTSKVKPIAAVIGQSWATAANHSDNAMCVLNVPHITTCVTVPEKPARKRKYANRKSTSSGALAKKACPLHTALDFSTTTMKSDNCPKWDAPVDVAAVRPEAHTQTTFDNLSARLAYGRLARWTVDDVHDFVQSIPGCGHYAEDFRQQHVTGRLLRHLSVTQLVRCLRVDQRVAEVVRSRVNSLMTWQALGKSTTVKAPGNGHVQLVEHT